jgi:hypothetical protein
VVLSIGLFGVSSTSKSAAGVIRWSRRHISIHMCVCVRIERIETDISRDQAAIAFFNSEWSEILLPGF